MPYNFSDVLSLYDTNQAMNNYIGGGTSNQLQQEMTAAASGDDLYETTQPANGNASDQGLADWLAQNYPELGAQTGQVNTFGQTADSGGVLDSIANGWDKLGPVGQSIIGSLGLGGLQSYTQQRQRDQELQKMGQMSEEQWQRQMLLKQAPTNKLADVGHFKGIVNSLRGSH